MQGVIAQAGGDVKKLEEAFGKSMEEIAELLNYKNSATAKNLKYKSLLRLKKICQEERKKAKESMYYE